LGSYIGVDTSFSLLELAKYGNCYSYVDLGAFPERYARFYFKQLCSAVKHVHDAGYCHLDLKVENILFAENYDLKLADFGFVCELSGPKKDGLILEAPGTQNYQAPEVLEAKKGYRGDSADVFSLGVILYLLIVGWPPWNLLPWSKPNVPLIA